ncbi:MAG TPA: hypothetical protein PKA06_02210 [Gemmatales bacterium]|nr:hypothetical protein [Gemmatales bacterium]
MWRRHRPTLRPHESDYQQIVRKIKRLLNGLSSDKLALFQDEADICTNPKIGSMWMTKGNQAVIEIPGNNEKRQLIGSLAGITVGW